MSFDFENEEPFEEPFNYEFQFAESDLIKQVWEKGKIIDGYKPSEWRKDKMGKIMHFSRHGETNSSYGWEIAHIIPKAIGGPDDISNLQPLHWQNNRTNGHAPEEESE